MRFIGRARDLVTSSAGVAHVLGEDVYEAHLAADRTIKAIKASPERPAISRLIGERGGGRLRGVLSEVLPEERDEATPLYLILDDISGASLIAGWAWSQWDPDWLAAMQAVREDPELSKAFKSRENVCIGHAPGSSAFDLSRRTEPESLAAAAAPDLRRPDDPEGWHAFTSQQAGAGLRRARRIDVWLDQVIVIDSAFQDSGSTPEGGRVALHEYSLRVTADPKSLEVLSVLAEPRVLPFVECPSATLNLSRLVGTPLPKLREAVLAELAGVAGCTHLNDALRALAETPALLSRLTVAP